MGTLFFFFFQLRCTWGLVGEKDRDNHQSLPQPTIDTCLQQKCSCKQLKFTVSKQLVPVQQVQKGTKRNLGKGRTEKAKGPIKTSRKDRAKKRTTTAIAAQKRHTNCHETGISKTYSMRQEPKWHFSKIVVKIEIRNYKTRVF